MVRGISNSEEGGGDEVFYNDNGLFDEDGIPEENRVSDKNRVPDDDHIFDIDRFSDDDQSPEKTRFSDYPKYFKSLLLKSALGMNRQAGKGRFLRENWRYTDMMTLTLLNITKIRKYPASYLSPIS